MPRRLYTGTIESKPYGDGPAALFLGTEVPLVADLARAAPPSAHATAGLVAEIDGCAVKRASGPFTISCTLRTAGSVTEGWRLAYEQIFVVGGKDVAELLARAVGRRARLEVTFRDR